METTEYITPDWPAPPSIKALTTTRHGGMSHSPFHTFNLADHVGDEPDRVATNRHLLHKKFSLPTQPIWLNQTHSTHIIDAATVTGIPTADASYSNKPNVVCAVLSGDCLPLLICDKAATVVSAIHAGWKGLANGVIENTINTLPVKPSDLLVWLGPAIGDQVYEVGWNVVSAFTQHDPAAIDVFVPLDSTHWLANLYALARMRLSRLGVTQIYGGNHCTYTEKNLFYSFRREGITGRMATLIWREIKP